MILKRPRTGTPADLLVIGLGNPGSEYAHTRHNIGQDAVELLASRHGVGLKRETGSTLSGKFRLVDEIVALGIPGVFMNLSGEGVAPLVRRFGIDDLTRLVIVHDELDLENGRVQIKSGGGLAGHNGLKSIKQHLKSDEFTRIRIGIDRPATQQPVSDYVLRRPSTSQQVELRQACERAADAAEELLRSGLQRAMNIYNR